MIEHLRVFTAAGFDPVINLAAETALMESVREGEMILYLWQNDHTVVIGRNQNIYRECSLAAMDADGITAVRRPSGGGAVYHDKGNLNFTLITASADHSIARQTETIIKALKDCGIDAQRSGRNDILVQGRKVSGNAYFNSHGHSLHHGTLLLSCDLAVLGRYLKPSAEKLKSKGVDSVRSRVMNLQEILPQISVPIMHQRIIHAFEQEYGCTAEEHPGPDAERWKELSRLYGSPEWIYGMNPTFTHEVSGRFAWGGAEAGFTLKDGMMHNVHIWSDSMEPARIEAVRNILEGHLLDAESLRKTAETFNDNTIEKDIIHLILKEERIWQNMI